MQTFTIYRQSCEWVPQFTPCLAMRIIYMGVLGHVAGLACKESTSRTALTLKEGKLQTLSISLCSLQGKHPLREVISASIQDKGSQEKFGLKVAFWKVARVVRLASQYLEVETVKSISMTWLYLKVSMLHPLCGLSLHCLVMDFFQIFLTSRGDTCGLKLNIRDVPVIHLYK